MSALAGPDASWTPPSCCEVQPAGAVWDAVRAPSYVGDRALARLGDASGAVIRDPYGHRLYWLVPPGVAGSWERMAHIDVYGPACWVEIPPAGRTRGPGPYWVIEPTPGRLLTNAGQLHEALATVVNAAYGPRQEKPQ